MRTYYFGKALLAIKSIYWTWLALCFLYWFGFLLAIAKLDMNGLVEMFFNIIKPIESYLFTSSLLMPVIFIIISITRKKISVWELGGYHINVGFDVI